MKYYLNGKLVDLKTIEDRKDAVLKSTEEIYYYEAPLTDKEKKIKSDESYNTHKFFSDYKDSLDDAEMCYKHVIINNIFI